ncbi:STAS domain-containing protein [Planctomycetes bacterium Pan216]
MKLRPELDGDRFIVRMEGEIDSSRCDCLAHFWDHYLDETLGDVWLDMSGVEEMDAQSVAVMVTLLRRQLEAGSAVTLEAAPQMLAHTLYKAGELREGGRLSLVEPRTEEPYAG